MALLGGLGLSFDSYGAGWAEAKWVPTELACNPGGTVHDAAMNFATNAALESGDRAATLELKYSTMRPARAGDELTVRGDVVQLTRQVAYVETTIRTAGDELVSRGTATFFVRRKPAYV